MFPIINYLLLIAFLWGAVSTWTISPPSPFTRSGGARGAWLIVE